MTPWSALKARDVMGAPVKSIARTATLHEAVRLFAEHRITGAPVVDEEGLPVGVVSLSDVMAALATRSEDTGTLGLVYLRTYQRWERGHKLIADEDATLEETLVSDVMTAEIISVGPDASLTEVAQVLAGRDVRRVLVMEGGAMQGVVTAMDLLRPLAEAGVR